MSHESWLEGVPTNLRKQAEQLLSEHLEPMDDRDQVDRRIVIKQKVLIETKRCHCKVITSCHYCNDSRCDCGNIYCSCLFDTFGPEKFEWKITKRFDLDVSRTEIESTLKYYKNNYNPEDIKILYPPAKFTYVVDALCRLPEKFPNFYPLLYQVSRHPDFEKVNRYFYIKRFARYGKKKNNSAHFKEIYYRFSCASKISYYGNRTFTRFIDLELKRILFEDVVSDPRSFLNKNNGFICGDILDMVYDLLKFG